MNMRKVNTFSYNVIDDDGNDDGGDDGGGGNNKDNNKPNFRQR